MTTPDKWSIVKIKSDDGCIYKVFANFYGGYLSGDSWLLNSGIESYTETKDYYLFNGFSGSVYQCYKKCEGRSPYGSRVYDGLIEKLPPKTMRTISVRTFKKAFNAKPTTL